MEIFCGTILALGFVLLPIILSVIATKRSSRLEEELKTLRTAVSDLQREMRRMSRAAEGSEADDTGAVVSDATQAAGWAASMGAAGAHPATPEQQAASVTSTATPLPPAGDPASAPAASGYDDAAAKGKGDRESVAGVPPLATPAAAFATATEEPPFAAMPPPAPAFAGSSDMFRADMPPAAESRSEPLPPLSQSVPIASQTSPSNLPPPYTPPPPPASPGWKQFDWEALIGVKLFSWVAGIALVIAAIYFLKYSVDHGWVSPPVRAAIGLITGSALLVLCELRVARGYTFTANAMHGAGIAILYATLFAMHALWRLLPPAAVFAGMLIVTAVAVALSLRRNSLFIALLGMLGGFATPALLSTGENRPVSLFSYLLLLNAGLALVAYRKRWPALTIGSVIFSVVYQWAWVAKFLDVAQLPLAAGIFLIFGVVAALALWIGRRDDASQVWFDRVGKLGAALPLLFAIFAAAVPAYGERYHILFLFLLLIAAGLAIIARFRDEEWLHALGAVAVVLTFSLWLIVSYPRTAWPLVLAWLSAFVILYLAIGVWYRSRIVIAAGAFLFVIPALIQIEPRTALPGLPFTVLFLLVAMTAFYAVRHREPWVYLSAAVLALFAQILWSAKHLSADNLYAALTIYTAFALCGVLVSMFSRNQERAEDAAGGFPAAAYLALSGHLLLLFVVTLTATAFPAWPFLAVLLILNLAFALAALQLGRGSLVLGGVVLSQLVLLVWVARVSLAPWPNVALVSTLGVAAYGLIVYWIARRRDERGESFRYAAIAALCLGHIVAMIAGGLARPKLFETLLATHVLLVIATLVLAVKTGTRNLAVLSVALTALAALLAQPGTPGRSFTFAAVLYALYIAYPLILSRRADRALEPYLAAVLASVPFFVLARAAITDAGYGYAIGLLPVGQALLMLVLLARLLRTEPPGERMLTRLAIVAAAALAFITVAVPLQLEKQWITIAWALQGAALVWLYRRVPHRGLLAWAAGLLAIVFVRLSLNPAVLSYHPSSDTPILNWYLYTYLVAATAFFVAARLAPSEYARAASAGRAAGTLLLFFLLNIEIADFYSTGPTLTFNFLSSSLAQDLTYTIGWALFAIAMLIAGIVLHNRSARVASIALLVVTIFKCFLHDLGRLGGLYRIASFLGLAVALVMVSVLLQKFVLSRRVAPEESAP